MPHLELESVTKSFKTGPAVDQLSLAVEAGEIVAVFGPSGAGKTVLLRLIAGIEEPDSGIVRIAGRDCTQDSPEVRGVGMAFQNFALFPHMSAYDNVASGLTATGAGREEIRRRVDAVAAMLKISHVMAHSPKELSNGQKQRTALARALVAAPKVLLLDDPLRNVDAKLRYEMRLELPNLLRRSGSAVLYVTQDYKEAMALADRIVVMLDGRVAQLDEPEAIYKTPVNVGIARLFGDPTINLLPVEPARNGTGTTVTIANTLVHLGHGFEAAAGRSCTLGLRPEDLVLEEESSPEAIPVDLLASTPLNERLVLLMKTLDGREVLASASEPPLGGRATGRAYLRFDPAAALLFDGATGNRLERQDGGILADLEDPSAPAETVHSPRSREDHARPGG